MDILVACECSGEVRDAFLAKGHTVLSCDLKASEIDGPHYQGDVLPLLFAGWDMLIGFPPCTYLCVSGIHWTTRGIRDPELTREAAALFVALWSAPIEKICIENPVGIMSSVIGSPTQIVQPYEFGHDASKKPACG